MSLFILNKLKKNITLDTIYVKDAFIHFFVMVFCGIINKANDGKGCIEIRILFTVEPYRK